MITRDVAVLHFDKALQPCLNNFLNSLSLDSFEILISPGDARLSSKINSVFHFRRIKIHFHKSSRAHLRGRIARRFNSAQNNGTVTFD